MDNLRLPHCQEARPLACPMCGALAVLPLDAETRAKQPDDTTHVCHPMLEGCNHGFALEARVYFPSEGRMTVEQTPVRQERVP